MTSIVHADLTTHLVALAAGQIKDQRTRCELIAVAAVACDDPDDAEDLGFMAGLGGEAQNPFPLVYSPLKHRAFNRGLEIAIGAPRPTFWERLGSFVADRRLTLEKVALLVGFLAIVVAWNSPALAEWGTCTVRFEGKQHVADCR